MTTPASNEADKPSTNTGSDNKSNTNTNKPKSGGGTGGVKVRLLAKSWQLPVEDDKGRINYVRYGRGDELEVTEETYELLNGPENFKPAFERLEEA